MKRVVLIIATALAVLVGVPPVIAAEAVANYSTKDGDLLVLIDAPCTTTLGVFASMPEDLRPEFKAAALRWQGAVLEACWALSEDGKHLLVDQNGATGIVEGGPFQPHGDPL